MTDFVKYIDISSYCEMMLSTIQKCIENRDFDGACIQLSAYLLEVYSRYQSGEINAKAWHETLRDYRRMTVRVIEEVSTH